MTERSRKEDRQYPECVFVGALPPPVGGVTVVNSHLQSQLVREGIDVTVVQPSWSTVLRHAVGRRGRAEHAIVAISGVQRIPAACLVGRLVGRQRIYIVHAPSPQYSKTALRAALGFDRGSTVLVSNSELLEELASSGPKVRLVQLRRPDERAFVRPETVQGVPGTMKLVTFCYEGHALYQIPETVAAVKEMIHDGVDLFLTVVLYGAETEERRRLRAKLAAEGADWLAVLEDLSQQEVAELMSESQALLRFTKQDGDSQVVREALSLGLRVLASSVCPRPHGVDLVEVTDVDLILKYLRSERVQQGPQERDQVETATSAILEWLRS